MTKIIDVRLNLVGMAKKWWVRAVFTGLVVAAAALFDGHVIDKLPDPAVRITGHAALITSIFMVSFWVFRRWAKDEAVQAWQGEQRLQAMKEFIAVTFDIVCELDRDRLIVSIVERAAAITDSPFASLLLIDKERNVIRFVAQTNYPRNFKGTSMIQGEGVAGMVWKTGQPVIVNNYKEWAYRKLDFDYRPLNAFIGIPLKWKDEIIGALSIASEATRRVYTKGDALMLQPFADLAAIAITNSAMYGEVISHKDELEKLDTVKTIKLEKTQEELIEKTARLQGLLKRMTQIQENERARIARDMHDSTTQLILGALYAAQALIGELESSAPAREHVKTLMLLLNQIESEIREAIRDLRPIILDQAGIATALEQYIKTASSLSGLKYQFGVHGQPHWLTEDMNIAIYRIVQEALQNVANHARAQTVSVMLQFLDNSLKVIVEDDGMGFNPAEKGLTGMKEFGLIGMQERAESIGAEIQLTSRPGEGTRLELVVPYPTEEQTAEGIAYVR